MKRHNIYSNATIDPEDPDYIAPGDYFSRASKERMAKAAKEYGPLIDNDRYQDDIDRAGGYDRYIAREKKNRSIYSSSENLVSGNLPSRIDNFLQDFAQSYGDITYTDIMNISDNDIPKIKSIVSKMKRELKDYYGDIYELSLEDSDFKKLCDELIQVIKLSKKESPKRIRADRSKKFRITEAFNPDDYEDEAEDVDVVFSSASLPKYNTREGARQMYYDALDMNIENASKDYCNGVVDAIEALFDGGWLNESDFRTDL